MTAIDELRKFHAELLKEAREAIARAEIVGRILEEAGRQSAPFEVKYDRERLSEPPRAVQPEKDAAPRCDCGLPAEFKKSAPQNPKQWAAYFCARPPKDPKNCGFKKWID